MVNKEKNFQGLQLVASANDAGERDGSKVVISSGKISYKVFFKIMYICYFGKKKSKRK